MLTGEFRSQVDALCNASWSGGIAKLIEVIAQIACLLFQRRLDDLHALEENRLGGFPPGITPANVRDQQSTRATGVWLRRWPAAGRSSARAGAWN